MPRFFRKRIIKKYKVAWFTLDQNSEVVFPHGTVFLGILEAQTTDWLTRPNVKQPVGVALVPQEDADEV